MAAKQKRRPEVTCFYREDGEELEKILKQQFRTVVQKRLREPETRR